MFDHLKETGLSYFAHMKLALGYFGRLQLCAIKVFVHTVFQDIFTQDASDEISRLHKEMHGE